MSLAQAGNLHAFDTTTKADESWSHGSRQRPHQILLADEIPASKSPDMKLPPQKINNIFDWLPRVAHVTRVHGDVCQVDRWLV